jgi:putative FmdB family regulatory protein
MPIYEFKCGDCGDVFEYLCFNTEDTEKIKCKSCGSENTMKLMSTFSSAAGSTLGTAPMSSSSACSPRGGFS